MSHKQRILEVALQRFAQHGIVATTIQDVADHADVAKASVLYHFSSKDELVNHALTPSLEALEKLLSRMEQSGLGQSDSREGFISYFVDFLITHRLATHVVVSHPYLADQIQALGKAQQMMGRMAQAVTDQTSGEDDRLRFGVAVSGATYALVSSGMLGVDTMEPEALREGLRSVLGDMMHAPAQEVTS